MYQKNIRSYTAQDSVGSYDWIFEGIDFHEGYKNMTDAEIQEWAAEVVQESKEHDIYEAKIEGDYSEEQLAEKLAEIEDDYSKEQTDVEKAIRKWIAEEFSIVSSDAEQRINDLLFSFATQTLAEMPVEDITDENVPYLWHAFLSKTAPDLVTKETLWSEVRGMSGAYPLRQCIAVNAVMTAAEAEHKLDWAQGTMAKACRRGQYPTARQSGGVWLIPRSAVMARLADTHTRYPDTDNADELLDDGKSVLSKIRNQKLPDEDTD